MKNDFIEKIIDASESAEPNNSIPLIGICVSYCYFDTLQFMLPVNYLHFNKLYVITQVDDIQTINFCKQFINVEILFYDFKNNNKRFDKYGAIKYAQQKVYQSYSNSWYLIIDSDIILPNNFINILINEKLNEDCIYGAYRLNILKTSELCRKNSFIERNERLHSNITNNILYRKKYPPSILGCFQLYKKKCYQPDNFNNAGWGDYHFGYENFNLFCNLNNLIYIHLGDSNKNWNGKLLPFTNDCDVNLNNFYFNCRVNNSKNIYFNEKCMIVNNGDLNFETSNNDTLASSREFCRDILNFYYGKQSYKIIEFGPFDDFNTKFLSNIFLKVYVVGKTIEFTNNANTPKVEYINFDITKDNLGLLVNDVDIILLYKSNNYKKDIDYIIKSLDKFKQLKYVIFGNINKLPNNENLIIQQLIDKNILIFERFIGVNDIIDNKNVHEGIICSLNANHNINHNINENDSTIIINKINKTNDTNILIIKNKTYSWVNGSITFLNYLQLDSTFGKGTYSIIDLFTFQVNFGNRNHILLFNDDYTEFTSTRIGDNVIVKGKLLIISENILEDKTYSWLHTTITFLKNGNMKTPFIRGKYIKIDQFTFKVSFGNNEYVFIFNNRFTDYIAKSNQDKKIVNGKLILLDEKILEYKTYSWNDKSITFLEDGVINSKFGKGNYRQIDLFSFNVIFMKREYKFVFNNAYSAYTATRLADNEIIKGSFILSSNVVEDKTYSWGNSSITFLKNGQMNAFGKGDYKQIDPYTVQANFGKRKHMIKFNGDYTEFTSTRIGDNIIVKGNLITKKDFTSESNHNNANSKNRIISNIPAIEDKTYSWGNSSITFLKNGQMNAFGKGDYKQIDPYTVQANFGKRKHMIKFNGDYTEFTSTRIGDNIIVKGNLITKKDFTSESNHNNANSKNRIISNIPAIEDKTYSWGNSSITFLKNGQMNAFGKGDYKQIDPYTVQANFGKRKHMIKFNGNYTEFTSKRIGDNIIVKGNNLSNIPRIEEKTFSWGNRSITFLKNNIMNAFGKGNFKQIDPYTVQANFGNKKHIIKFNSDYTEFTSTRIGDNIIVKGNQI